MHVQKVRKSTVVFVEKMLVQHGASDQLAAMQGQVFQQSILAGGQHHRLSSTRDLSRRSIDYYLANRHQRCCLTRRTPDKRSQPRQDLLYIEGFDDVIVRPGIQSPNSVADRVPRG